MILLYHRILPDHKVTSQWSMDRIMTESMFQQQVSWLKKNFRIVSLEDYLRNKKESVHKSCRCIALTFDDGFKTTFDYIYPILSIHQIPATVFVTTGHLEGGKLLWFSYLNALCFEKQYDVIAVGNSYYSLKTQDSCRQAWRALAGQAQNSRSPVDFCERIAKTYPISRETVAEYEGMTKQQLIIAGRDDLLEIGGHTVNHPILVKMTREEQKKEILEGKDTLAGLIGQQVRYFAYPSGEYNNDSIELVKKAGFNAAFAVTPKRLNHEPLFEIERVGVYSNSIIILWLKIMGVASLMRYLRLRVG